MSNDYISNQTPEQRAAALEKGRIARQEKKEWAEKNLKLTYEDDEQWVELAKEAGTKLPQKYSPCSDTKYLKRLLKHLKLDEAWFQEYSGCRTIKELVKMNPETTARAMCGQFLEAWYEIKEKK